LIIYVLGGLGLLAFVVAVVTMKTSERRIVDRSRALGQDPRAGYAPGELARAQSRFGGRFGASGWSGGGGESFGTGSESVGDGTDCGGGGDGGGGDGGGDGGGGGCD